MFPIGREGFADVLAARVVLDKDRGAGRVAPGALESSFFQTALF